MEQSKRAWASYWLLTTLLALELLVGGAWDLLRRPEVVHVVTRLGYPVYLLFILGVWKWLAALAVLAPGRSRLKEWAYAGVFFEMSGAAISQAVRGSAAELALTLALVALTMGSWALRPPSRRLGGDA